MEQKELIKLNPIDDIMFRKMAEDREFVQEILRVFLEDDGLIVTESIPQWNGTSLQGRSVILDALAITGKGERVNIEIQKSNDDDHQKRVRYNSSVITASFTPKGIDFSDLTDVIVVFISEFDIFKGRKSVYHIDRVIRETGDIVDNGLTEVYINARVKDGTPASDLLRVFTENDNYDRKFPKTSEIKRRLKCTEEGLTYMSIRMNEYREQFREEFMAEGEAKIMAKLVNEENYDYDKALKVLGMSEEEFSTYCKRPQPDSL